MAILVLGGAGYIGSHTVYELIDAGNEYGEYIYAKLFVICGKKKNMLCYMNNNQYREHFALYIIYLPKTLEYT